MDPVLEVAIHLSKQSDGQHVEGEIGQSDEQQLEREPQ